MTGKRIEAFRRRASDVLAPMRFRCLGCGADIFDDTGFCPRCVQRVTFNNGKTCKRCGVALDGEEDYCGNCAFEKTYFDRAYSPFVYDGLIRQAILDMKFNNLGANARVFARYLAYIAVREQLQYDVVTYAPMSAKSLKKRRYNQARLLAEEFCAILDKDALLADTVVKIRDTAPQEQLSGKERRQNLVGSYRFRQGADVKGKRVLLIDDVKTTGATVNECAKVLKSHGAAEVVALTVASRKEHIDFENKE